MNVEDFAGYSEKLTIKWYFVFATAMLITLIIIVCVLKRIGWEVISAMNKRVGSFLRRHRPCNSHGTPGLEANKGAFLVNLLQLQCTSTEMNERELQMDMGLQSPLPVAQREGERAVPIPRRNFATDIKPSPTIKEQEVVVEHGYFDMPSRQDIGGTSRYDACNGYINTPKERE